jgi:hypothetical protein
VTIRAHSKAYLSEIAVKIGALDGAGNPDISEAANYIIYQYRFTGGCIGFIPQATDAPSSKLPTEKCKEVMSDAEAFDILKNLAM